jgi:hypothetical protein
MVFRLWIPETHILLLFALDFFPPVGISVEINSGAAKKPWAVPEVCGELRTRKRVTHLYMLESHPTFVPTLFT